MRLLTLHTNKKTTNEIHVVEASTLMCIKKMTEKRLRSAFFIAKTAVPSGKTLRKSFILSHVFYA